MKTNPAIYLHEIIPESEVPSLEALKALPEDHSILFPAAIPSHAPREIGNYNNRELPLPGSLVHPLLRGVQTVISRSQRRLVQQEENADSFETRLSVAVLQKKLISSIDTAYTNLTYEDFPHVPATYIIDEYINNQDEIRRSHYASNVQQRLDILDKLRAKNSTLYIPGKFETRALASDREIKEELGKVEDKKPISKELKREAYRQELAKDIKGNRLFLERLKFEWLSAVAITGFLREAVDPAADRFKFAKKFGLAASSWSAGLGQDDAGARVRRRPGKHY